MHRAKLSSTMEDIRYVRAPVPLSFPSTDPEWEMGQALRHHRLCEMLYVLLREAAGSGASVGCDQFLYFDPRASARKCAPDGFVKLGVPQTIFDSWKTWERGVPELCVEILSSDTEEKLTLEEKLERFHAMGVSEVVVFQPEAEPGRRIRAWDLLSGDLVERVVTGDATPSRTLGRWFVVGPGESDEVGIALRLAEDRGGELLLPTPLERERLEKERERVEKERERLEKEHLRAEAARERAEKERLAAEVAALRAKLGG